MIAGRYVSTDAGNPVTIRVEVERLTGKKLRLRARGHTLIADRTIDDGGTDGGCTSGELLLMAIGSCSTGSLRNFLEAQGLDASTLKSEVSFQPSDTPGQRDSILIAVHLTGDAAGLDDETLERAATSGSVTSRVKLGSKGSGEQEGKQ